MKLRSRLAVLATVPIVLAACSINVYEEGSFAGGGGGGGGEGAAVNQEPDTGEIAIAGAASGDEANAIQGVIDEGVNDVQDEFTATYTGSDSFEQNVIIQIEGGTPPDIGFFPQPGTVIEQAAQGNAIALEDMGFDIADLEARFGEYLMSLGEYEGKHYGMPDTVNFKSAIWYNVPAFEDGGYEIPETWEDLIALSDQMVADGQTPWCIGTGSEAATGWPATDWMEDIVLRQAGTDAYDAWVAGELPFSSPEITAAAESFGDIIFTEGYVFGGAENISSTDFRDAPDPMFNDPPNCLMHRQATFIPAFFPDGVVPFEDYDFFPFPTIDGNEGVLMAGGLAAIFSNRQEIVDFFDLYTSADVQCLYGKQENTTTMGANVDVSPDCYTQNELIGQASIPLAEAIAAGTARFDASDLMPPAVGSGEFWNGMNEYTNDGPDNLEQVLADIDAAFPSDGGGGGESEAPSESEAASESEG
ncbi:ABC transporter substrate-binding protein [Salsipaludibacter albus]|uniref:ABC transporter substrate-binding protein n=1 Tax=Salsipaludibacter albus TaxID=2849650 RepID=UPI001EE4E03E|nr:ABC transporter substrate-binding protein [Salsipaludibacter albus]MBY5160909.1 ABC transporter substrate-binding protein [Salsipaludibacter albus]